MRQVFSSARLANVEQVAQMLRDAGIEVKVTEGRSFNTGGFRGTGSYVDAEAKKPAVWVIKSEDQVRARELLREEGLIDSTRGGAEAYAMPSFRTVEREQAASPASKRAFRVKMALIAGIVIVLVVTLMRSFGGSDAGDASAPVGARNVAQGAEVATAPFGTRQPVLPSLARAVLVQELAKDTFPAICIALDGADAPAEVLAAVTRPGLVVLPASQCRKVADEATGSVAANGAEALVVDVFNFTPTGPAAGTVQVDAYFHRQSARYKTLQVARVGNAWRVVKTVKFVAF